MDVMKGKLRCFFFVVAAVTIVVVLGMFLVCHMHTHTPTPYTTGSSKPVFRCTGNVLSGVGQLEFGARGEGGRYVCSIYQDIYKASGQSAGLLG